MKKLFVPISILAVMTSVSFAKEPKKMPVEKFSPSKQESFDRMPASEGEEISSLERESGVYHVAQVVEQTDLKIKKFEGGTSLVSVYNGSVTMPFEGFLTIFDPNPQDGGDFGTYKTFSLGRSGSGLKLIDSKLYQIKADEQIVSLAFTASKWDPETDKTTVKILRFRVKVNGGVVASKAVMSLKDK